MGENARKAAYSYDYNALTTKLVSVIEEKRIFNNENDI